MEALAKGLTRIVLLSTRTGAWFQDRGYRCEGLAHASHLLPASRRAQVTLPFGEKHPLKSTSRALLSLSKVRHADQHDSACWPMLVIQRLNRAVYLAQVNASRNSLLYVKDLEVDDPTAEGGVLATSRDPTAGIGAPLLANLNFGVTPQRFMHASG